MSYAIKQRMSSLIFFVGLVLTYLIAIKTQHFFVFNHDASWLSEAARRMLEGGSYTENFFENNPPMILYLYTLPVLFSKIFSVNIAIALRGYIFLIATLSLFICYDLLKKLLADKHLVLIKPLLVMLAVIYLVLPFYEFGQREHLLILFTTPYFLLAAYQLNGGVVSNKYATGIGLLAGLGFAIKPYFLFALVLVELYYIIQQRNLLAFMRKDVFAIMLVFVTYLTLVFLFNPDYIFTILPYALHWCRLGDTWPFSKIMRVNSVYFCEVALLYALLQYKENPYKNVITVLSLALIGFLFAFIAQQTNYNYHLLPALSISVFLCTFLYFLQMVQGTVKKSKWLVSILFIGFLAWVAYWNESLKYLLIAQPLIYFTYFAVIFMLVLSFMAVKKGLRSLIFISSIIGAIIGVCILLNVFLHKTDLIFYRFYLITFFLLAFFVVGADRILKRKAEPLLLAALGITLFALPANYFFVYFYAINYHVVPSLAQFLQDYGSNKSIYVISAGNEVYPYVTDHPETHIKVVSRFSGLWMVGSIVKAQHYLKNVDVKQQLAAKNFLVQMVTDDINQNKPFYVFVDARNIKQNLYIVDAVGFTNVKMTNIKFDYIDYFSQYENFARAWKPYHYVKTITSIYNKPFLDIYQREAGA